MTDSLNLSSGQYSSLSDLSMFMQTLLDPRKINSPINPYSVREWLRPIHAWSDDLQEVGAPWEITKYTDSRGQRQRLYKKGSISLACALPYYDSFLIRTAGGNLLSYRTHFAVNPTSSYGVIVLVTGKYADTAHLAHEAIQRFQPVFDHLQERAASDAFGGRWVSDDEEDDQVIIRVYDGSLWIRKLVLNGTDVLALLQGQKPGQGKPSALWSTGAEREGEFR
jgi:hypothetical protein